MISGILNDMARSTEDASPKVEDRTTSYPFQKPDWEMSRRETSSIQSIVKANDFLWSLETTQHI